ncbi:hypothetical protein ACRE_003520 [Hapsidospora chrysogenum ATCC 11550]|uniref:Uncharacterized protein n=1 Tax=Hapsidospora chrysogenum (strain ATCC 11550 / CBS 779.69 / DSM 880 / IAM 14645 / JCM 23072 / IMI 49137) TaxID=857340 RepID=A0A086TH99_HAPC1|nr:hypothetical protein ACRE_003520 [Hapsidospora chrysogenum ATCC 11550]
MAPFPLNDDGLRQAREILQEPTRTENPSPTLALRAEAETVTVIAESGGGSSGGSNLSGGAIAGIVVGSILGTLLLIWVIRSFTNMGSPPGPERETMYRHVEPSGNRRRHRSKHSHSRRRSSSLSAPPPVVVRESSSRRHPKYVYADPDTGRGRRLY